VKILLHLQIGVGAEKILLIKVTHILEVVKILLLLQIGVGAEKILLPCCHSIDLDSPYFRDNH
jgi:hypothetical protein